MSAAPTARAASMTWVSSGRPASGCRTLGKSEFIRLPWPAARITTLRGISWIHSGPNAWIVPERAPRAAAPRCSVPARRSATGLAQLLDGLQLRRYGRELGFRGRDSLLLRARADG